MTIASSDLVDIATKFPNLEDLTLTNVRLLGTQGWPTLLANLMQSKRLIILFIAPFTWADTSDGAKEWRNEYYALIQHVLQNRKRLGHRMGPVESLRGSCQAY